MIAIPQCRHDAEVNPKEESKDIEISLNRLLAHQFLSVMLEQQEIGDFSGGTAGAQFKSFLTEQYSSKIFNNGIFILK